VALAFTILAAALISVKPLIMDEVLTLIAARQSTLREVLARTREHTGNVPLGFLIEHLSLELTGYSIWLARLPSALFGIASVAAVGVLASKLRAPSPLLAATLFAAFPLTLRYTLEVRPYIPALFFSILLTLLFLELSDRPTLLTTLAYAITVALTLYIQPFAALVCGAHFFWSLAYKKWHASITVAIASVVAVAAFVPWYLWARSLWSQEVVVRFIRFDGNAKTPLMLFREIAGLGYWGMGVVVLLCLLGAAKSRIDKKTKVLLLLLIAVPLVGAVLADAAFGYFLAARQFLWMMPALAILAVSAWDARPRETAALTAIAMLLCGYKSIRYFTQPEPDWQFAATTIAAEVDRGACFRVVPQSAHEIYAYFAPDVDKNSGNCPSVIAAVIPGYSDQDRDVLFNELLDHGYTKLRTGQVGGSSLTMFRLSP
jgi:Dolichyl-phosphate-mannose-protein mannosyltransferase